MRKLMGTQCMVFSTLAKMPLHRDRSFRSSESVEEVQPFCPGRKFRARRKFRGPKGSGMAGRSGGRKLRDDRKVWGPEVPGVGNLPRTETSRSRIWAEKLGEKPKSEGRKKKLEGRKGREARSTRNKANPWIKSNKISTHQLITKKNWGYFWWGFSDLGRKQQNQARKRGVGAPKT